MEELINFKAYPVSEVLNKLLQDKTTNKNIVFATDSYKERGYQEASQITEKSISEFSDLELQPRVYKATKEQSDRTRKKAEVFTPLWICEEMNKLCIENFSGDWKKSVDITTLEITCGEAPFLVSRYDATTGEKVSIENRVGILDRKLKLICENTDNEKDWLKYAKKAYKSTYGYELQGDNLLIARINLLMTFCEYFLYKFNREADKKDIKAIAEIIAWNLWQMDGLKDTVPFGEPENDFVQLSFFDEPEEKEEKSDCIIKNWKTNKEIKFKSIKEGKEMKFDFVIGNPPYQTEAPGTSTSDIPVYHLFMEASYSISDKVELITPGRFLFNAGATPTAWNKNMLNNPNIKVMYYEQDSSKVFANTDIKGGIVVTYRDLNKNFGSIGTFTIYPQLNTVLKKVKSIDNLEKSIDDIIYNQNKFNLDELNSHYPDLNRTDKRFESNIFQYDIFKEQAENEDDIKVLGLISGKRVYRYINRKFVDMNHETLEKYKVLLPRSNGSGAIGEVLSTPLIGTPLIGYTKTFIAIGSFDNELEANNCFKYIKSKFARTMLGVLKITQQNTKGTWKYVPLQDFTENSDIDWTKSIAEIDKQLYKKYNLSQEEIDFIESHVKEME